MSRPIRFTQTGIGSSAVVPMDINRVPYKIGVGCVGTGIATFKLQGTFDDVYDSAVTPTYFDVSGFATTANAQGVIEIPYTGLKVAISSGTGSVAVTLVPQGLI